MSLESISQQTAVTCGSRFCNLFQNRYVAGSTLVITAVVSFFGVVLLILEIRDKLLTTQQQRYMESHPYSTQLFPAAVGTVCSVCLISKGSPAPNVSETCCGNPSRCFSRYHSFIFANTAELTNP